MSYREEIEEQLRRMEWIEPKQEEFVNEKLPAAPADFYLGVLIGMGMAQMILLQSEFADEFHDTVLIFSTLVAKRGAEAGEATVTSDLASLDMEHLRRSNAVEELRRAEAQHASIKPIVDAMQAGKDMVTASLEFLEEKAKRGELGDFYASLTPDLPRIEAKDEAKAAEILGRVNRMREEQAANTKIDA